MKVSYQCTKLRKSCVRPGLTQGTFYMMVKCPRGLSGVAFAWALEEERVMVVPGEIMGLPGHIRLSLTCSDAMVDYALPVFERLLKK